jgi:hypothetical protein
MTFIMFNLICLTSYRLIATLAVLTPLAINLITQGGLVTSLLYAPLLTLVLLLLSVYCDTKLVAMITHKQYLSRSHQLKKQQLGFSAIVKTRNDQQ